MKFQAPVASFMRPLQQLAAIAGGNANEDDIAHKILMVVADNHLFLRTTDYKIELSFTVEVAVEKEGRLAVDAQKFREACSRLDSNAIVSFSYDEIEEILTISSAATLFNIRTITADDFPLIEQEEVDHTIELTAGQLRAAIERSIFCIPSDDFRDYLKGMRLEAEGSMLAVITSDGHRISINETPLNQSISDSFGLTLLKHCASELYKIVQNAGNEDIVKLSFSKNLINTTINNYHLTSKLNINPYPNVRVVIPKSYSLEIVVNREELKKTLSRVAVLSAKKIRPVTLKFEPGKILLSCENPEHETASDVMPLPSYDGDPVEITLNASYVIDTLNGLSFSENAVFNFVNASQIAGALITPEKQDDSGVKTSYFIARIVV